MTIKESILKSLEDSQRILTHNEIYEHIIKQNYYDFKDAKTPTATVSALLGDFIRKNDQRVKRIKGEKSTYLYYLAKFEQDLNINDLAINIVNKSQPKQLKKKQTYSERDLHKLLSSYLKNKKTYAKTILHEESKNSKDDHQKWIHPDMIGIDFISLSSTINKTFMKIEDRLKERINNRYNSFCDKIEKKLISKEKTYNKRLENKKISNLVSYSILALNVIFLVINFNLSKKSVDVNEYKKATKEIYQEQKKLTNNQNEILKNQGLLVKDYNSRN